MINIIDKSSNTYVLEDVNDAMLKLTKMIDNYQAQGIEFERIINNSIIKYDIFKNNFYTFKHHGKHSKCQLRILYRFIRIDNNSYDIEVHKIFDKKQPTKKYIDIFENYVKTYNN